MQDFKHSPWTWISIIAVFVLIAGATIFGRTALQKGAFYRLSAPRQNKAAPMQTGKPTMQTTRPVIIGSAVRIAVAANDAPENPNKLLPNIIVTMYAVTPVGPGNYSGRAVASGVTQANGAGVMFTVQPGDIVDFVAFSNGEKAGAAAAWTFTAPPYKNFSATDGNTSRLCQIDMLDTAKKMKMENGQDSCGESFSYPVSDKKVVDSSATMAFPQISVSVSCDELRDEVSCTQSNCVWIAGTGRFAHCIAKPKK